MGGLEYETLVNKTMLWRKNHSWQQPGRGISQNRTGMSIDNVLSPAADLVCSCIFSSFVFCSCDITIVTNEYDLIEKICAHPTGTA